MTTGFMTRARGLLQPHDAGHGAVSRRGFAALVGVGLALAIGLRVYDLAARPMHHDEANQAVKFGVLLETGRYQYDRTDHHGPTLYYLTLPAAWLRGQASLAALDETTLRIVPAGFGVALLLLFLLLTRRLGRAAVASAILLAAVSPVLVFYSRVYIQESIFACLAIACLIALGRYGERPTTGGALAAGACAGLAYATKETSIIVLPAAVMAVALARRWAGPGGHRIASRMMDARLRPPARDVAAGAAAALAVAWLFFSSFGSHPGGLVDSIRAFGIFIQRGTDSGAHTQPWHYYLGLLAWSSSGGTAWTEVVVLALSGVGLVAACRPGGTYWQRTIALYAVLSTAAYSAISYKTPWNILPFYAGLVLLAGIGVQALSAFQWGQIRLRPTGRQANLTPLGNDRRALTPSHVLLAVLLLAACAHLGWQSWRAIGRFAADPRNPYVYAHTSPDALRLVRRVADLAAVDADHERMLVRVIAGPYEQWPLPWYLRRMTRVGYWRSAAEAGPLDGTPVVIASQENAAAVDAALGDGHVSEMYGLRPGVFLTLFVERGLWDRYLATR
jgi:uncharacterized protein (TIGR03663 family)